MRILVFRTDNIGDLVCTTPLLAALRQRYPTAWIGVLTNSYSVPVLVGHPAIDAALVYRKAKHLDPGESVLAAYWQRLRLVLRLRRTGIDLAILAAAPPQPAARRFARWIGARQIVGGQAVSDGVGQEAERIYRGLAKALDLRGTPPACTVVADQAQVARQRANLPAEWQGRRLVGLHISARKPSQRWPVAHWIELIRTLSADPTLGVLLFWSPGDAANPRHPGDDAKAAAILEALPSSAILPVSSVALAELIAGLSLCDHLILADGGAMHIAAGLGKPIVCLFGDSDASRWHPWGVPFELLQPASRDVRDITVDEVLAAQRRLLDRIGAYLATPPR